MTYSSFSRSPGHDLEWLIAETFPGLRHVHAERLRMEEQLGSGTLAMADRERLFNEVFQRFGSAGANGKTGVRVDRTTSLGCVATIVMAAMVSVFGLLLQLKSGHLLAGAAAVLVIGGVLSVVRLLRNQDGPSGEEGLARLAADLRPLKPNGVEIQYCARKMAEIGFASATHIDPVKLLQAIGQDPDVPR